jgi:hypothetical protein
MNCEHHNVKRRFDNELICTACSPAGAGENRPANTKKPIKSMLSAFRLPELFTAFLSPDPAGEKVYVFPVAKNHRVVRRSELVVSTSVNSVSVLNR